MRSPKPIYTVTRQSAHHTTYKTADAAVSECGRLARSIPNTLWSAWAQYGDAPPVKLADAFFARSTSGGLMGDIQPTAAFRLLGKAA